MSLREKKQTNKHPQPDLIEKKGFELQGILDGLNTAIAVVDENFDLYRINQKALELGKKKSFEKALGQKCYKLFFNEDKPCTFCIINRRNIGLDKIYEKKIQDEQEIEIKKSVGFNRIRKILIHRQYSIRGSDQKFLLAESFDDITEKREKEEEHARNSKLISLGTLVQAVAHELTNPIAGINLTLESMEGVELSSQEVQNKVRLLKNDIELASVIVEEIRAAIAPQNYPKDPIVVYDFLKNMIENCKKNSTFKMGIYLAFKPAKSVMILGNKNKLRQVFWNLFKNSIEAFEKLDRGKSQKPRIRIRVVEIKEENYELPNILEVHFKDNGGGIPKSVIKRIFDPFYSTKRLTRGTGLGLFIVRKILEEHRAVIEVESKDGFTTFFIRFKIYSHG